MMNGKKAQGALEFLMTYGWAFLVILIMIGALAYFGVLNPTKFLPERCSFGTQFMCKDYQLATGASAPQNLIMLLQNNLGSSIAIDISVNGGFDVSNTEGFSCGALASGAITNRDGTPLPTDTANPTNPIVGDGQTFLVTFAAGTCTGGALESSGGSKFKTDVELYYYDPRSGPSFGHTVKGEIFATVEEYN